MFNPIKKYVLTTLRNGWILLLGLIAIAGNSGLWLMPNLSAQFQVSQSLTRNAFVFPEEHYLYTNYLQPALFGILGLNKFRYYAVYALFITVLFLALFCFWFVRYHGRKIAIREMKLFAALTFPVFAIPFFWIGMDGMTLLLMLLTLISLSSPWVLLPAILLGIQHFEQGFLGFSLLGLSIVISGIPTALRLNGFNLEIAGDIRPMQYLKTAVVKILPILLGIVFGKLLLSGWFNWLNLEILVNRKEYLDSYSSLFLSRWLQSWPLIAWSFLGVGWLLLIAKIKVTWPLLLVSLGTFFFTALVADQTRVGIIVLFPSLFYWIMMNSEIWQSLTTKFSIALVILYLILPPVVVWGKPYNSLLPYNFEIVQEIMQHGLNLENMDWPQPFQY